MFIFNVDVSIKVNKSLLPELLRKLMTIILNFSFLLIDFRLETLNHYFFLFNIFMVVIKKLSNFSTISFFNICFEVIFFCLTLSIVSIFFKFWNIKNKKTPNCIQYLRKNIIELFIISSKILYFFIYKWPKIIRYWPNFVMSNEAKLLIFFPTNNIE